jgi:hypothetical protein
MVYGITFTDQQMTKSADICVQGMKANNVGAYSIVRPEHLDKSFTYLNSEIFNQERGCGYWLWKPWAILNSLLMMKPDDVLLYMDAGVRLMNNINYLVEKMEGPVWLFGNKWRHVDWCKGDVLFKINNSQLSATKTMSGTYWSFNGMESFRQAQASVILVRNTPYARAFVKEWLCWCQMPGLIDDTPSQFKNATEFREHRHDQAILTSLAIREGIKLHWWPASYNKGAFVYDKEGYETDDYPVMFDHHRLRNHEYA